MKKTTVITISLLLIATFSPVVLSQKSKDKKAQTGKTPPPQKTQVKKPQIEPEITRRVGIHMRGLACDKTTESGADEVFIMVIGRRSDGTVYAERIPGEGQHWDMNDGDQPTNNSSGDSHIIAGKDLFVAELPQGQTWEVLFTIREEDNGNTAKAQAAAAALLVNSRNPYAAGAGAILGALTVAGMRVDDTDDTIGSFGAQIYNDKGNLIMTWKNVDRVASEIVGTDGRGNNGHEFRMNGDGSNYVGWYHFRAWALDGTALN